MTEYTTRDSGATQSGWGEMGTEAKVRQIMGDKAQEFTAAIQQAALAVDQQCVVVPGTSPVAGWSLSPDRVAFVLAGPEHATFICCDSDPLPELARQFDGEDPGELRDQLVSIHDALVDEEVITLALAIITNRVGDEAIKKMATASQHGLTMPLFALISPAGEVVHCALPVGPALSQLGLFDAAGSA